MEWDSNKPVGLLNDKNDDKKYTQNKGKNTRDERNKKKKKHGR